MAEPAFDTLTIAKELEQNYGFEAKQAEGAAVMIHRHLVGNVATKDDLRRLEETLVAKLATKDEVALIHKEVAHVSADLKWIKVIGGVIVAVIVLPWFKDLALAVLN